MRPAYASMPALPSYLRKRPGSVFFPRHRIRMNILPMFFGIALPWMIFVLCSGITTFMTYTQPMTVKILIACVCCLWLVLLGAAVRTRLRVTDPSWLSYLTMAVFAAIVLGIISGLRDYNRYGKPWHEVQELRFAKNINVAETIGSDMMDVGIVHFERGSHISAGLSWHFQNHGSLYCVSPIVSNRTHAKLARYDFWAVGKDCCSTEASDFRCGAWGSKKARSGLRVVDDGDAAFYRLAVQQAESLYYIEAPRPIFFTWSLNPEAEWMAIHQAMFNNFIFMAVVFLVASVFGVAMFMAKLSWLGRTYTPESMYIDDSEWQVGGRPEHVDTVPVFYGASD